MAHTLLTLTLIAAQVFPWVGGPLFACVSRDGEVCRLDRGPGCCPRCEGQGSKAATRCEGQACCGGHDHAANCAAADLDSDSREAEWSATPCDCRHELVAQAPAVSAIRGSQSAADLNHDAWAAAGIAVVATHAAERERWAAAVSRNGPALNAARASQLESIVIRC